MPDEQDDNLVPPLKVMRKRLNGVYRADSGFSGPTRRYVLIVALLVGLASIPTLAAITAGSNELSNGKTDTMDVPFLPPASPGPVQTRRRGAGSGSGEIGSSPAPSPSRSTATSAAPPSADPSASPSPSTSSVPSSSPVPPPSPSGASRGAQAVVRAGRIVGQAGRRKDRPEPVVPDRDEHVSGAKRSHAQSSGAQSGAQSSGAQSSGAGHPSKSSHPSAGHEGSKHSSGSHPASAGSDPSLSGFLSDGGFPSVPGIPALPGFNAPDPAGDDGDPAGDDAGSVGDDADPVGDDDSGSDSSDPDPEQPSDPDDPAAWADRPVCHERGKCGTRPSHHHRPDFSRHRQCDTSTHRAHWSHHRTIHIDRSSGRSEQRRRSAVTERPQNVRPARVLERNHSNGGHNSRRTIPEARNPESRADDNQIAGRSYHGSHRAAGQHHADRPTPAEQRSSRVGRHHADPNDANLNR